MKTRESARARARKCARQKGKGTDKEILAMCVHMRQSESESDRKSGSVYQ